ncbi:hypothetical protein B0H14DRAFT_3498444 [Mycena olivaceomarginata]|nr:hypothetical protein B0H14DRAFT_3498444 [Mycena olivaceomarginata]
MRVYSMRCFTRLCLAPERTLAGCLGPGPGVVSSLGFSTTCGGVCRASVGRSRLGFCSPPPAFPGPPQARTRTSLSARDPASAPASASAPPYKTSHDASSSACARIPACPHRACGELHVAPPPYVRTHHSGVVQDARPPLGVSAWLLPSPCPLRSPGIGSCVPGRRAPHEHIIRDAYAHESDAPSRTLRHTLPDFLSPIEQTPSASAPAVLRPVCTCSACGRACASLLLGCAYATHDAH